jgi:histidine ammonia-lyase
LEKARCGTLKNRYFMHNITFSTTKIWGLAKDILSAHGLRPIELKAKEGLALINGTTLICT